MSKFLPVLIFLLSTQVYSSDDFVWFKDDGQIAPNRENQKAISGFGAWLLVTPDKNWEEKWNTPYENVPYFSEAENVEIGQELTILPFFANPKLDDNRAFEIVCDIQVKQPDGTFSIDEKNIPCASGQLNIDPKTIFLTQTVIKYIGEQGDPYGLWSIHFVMKDQLRGVSIPLETSFNLVESKTNKPIKRD